VVVTNVSCCGSNQASQGGDQLASLVEVTLGSVFAKPTLNCGCAHQVYGSGGDYLHRWNFGNVTHLVGYVLEFGHWGFSF
jgi:hypothetical protein